MPDPYANGAEDYADSLDRQRVVVVAHPDGFISVELLQIERKVSDDLREQNAKLRVLLAHHSLGCALSSAQRTDVEKIDGR